MSFLCRSSQSGLCYIKPKLYQYESFSWKYSWRVSRVILVSSSPNWGCDLAGAFLQSFISDWHMEILGVNRSHFTWNSFTQINLLPWDVPDIIICFSSGELFSKQSDHARKAQVTLGIKDINVFPGLYNTWYGNICLCRNVIKNTIFLSVMVLFN